MEKEELNNLKVKVCTPKERVVILKKESDGQKQYLRRSYLLVNKIRENKDKITDDLVINFIKDTKDIELSEKDIDRSRHIGKPSHERKYQ